MSAYTYYYRRSQVGGVSITAESYAGLSAWYDASDAASLPDAVIDGLAEVWLDGSGNGNDLAGSATWATSGINGRRALVFAGTTYFSGAKSATLDAVADTCTIFVVARLTNFTGTPVLLIRGSAGNNAIGLAALAASGIPYGTTWASGLRVGNTAIVAGTPFVLAYARSGAGTDDIYINGVLTNSGTISSVTVGTDAGGIILGAGPGGSTNRITGALGELALYSQERTAGEIAEFSAALMTKWGVT